MFPRHLEQTLITSGDSWKHLKDTLGVGREDTHAAWTETEVLKAQIETLRPKE